MINSCIWLLRRLKESQLHSTLLGESYPVRNLLLSDPTIHQELLYNADTDVADRSTHKCQRCARAHHLCQSGWL